MLPRGLYAITPDEPDTERLLALVQAALNGGAAIVQYRNKAAATKLRHEQALALQRICRAAGVPLIVNDDLEIALAIDADGLHLGGEDGDLAAARSRLGPDKLLGASCYNRLELAIEARDLGADHVAFGAMYISSTKPGAIRAPLELFGQAAASVGLPAVAIGGITLDNTPPLIRAGAHAAAVISALFNAPDVTQRARDFNRLFSQ
ncbi:MAG TPA: thiamine phosphate synthase [Burkholderiales bacterium]